MRSLGVILVDTPAPDRAQAVEKPQGMTDAEYEVEKARVNDLIPLWSVPLLAGWHVTHEFIRDAENFKTDGETALGTVAICKADWRYRQAYISWNMPRVKDHDAEDLEWIFVHECCHVLINETRDKRPDGDLNVVRDDWLAHEERVCTELASAILRIRDLAAGTKAAAA